MIFLYSRVSHKASAASGISVEEQCAQLLNYCSTNIPHDRLSTKSFDSDFEGVFVDKAVSGWSKPFTQRPAGKLLDSLLCEGDHVVCYSIDRLARNMRDFVNTLHYWQGRGVNVHYVADSINTSTAMGKFQAHIKASIAQFSSDITSERTREALAIKRMRAGLEPCKTKAYKRPWMPSEYIIPMDRYSKRQYGNIYRYERVSKDWQYTSGLGLEHQSIANLEYAERHARVGGGTVGEAFVEDAISAFNVDFADRPEAKRLLSILKPGDDLVVYRSDRAWRAAGDAARTISMLYEKGVYVHLVNEAVRTDIGDGIDWISIIADLGTLESSMKRRRGREAIAYLRRNGRPTGTIQKGFKAVEVNGHQKLKLDMDVCAVTVAAKLMREDMGLSLNAVRDVLCAWRCQAAKKRMTLKHLRGHSLARDNIAQANKLQSMLPADVWDTLLDKAWALIRQPIEPEYWHVMDWEWVYGNERAA